MVLMTGGDPYSTCLVIRNNGFQVSYFHTMPEWQDVKVLDCSPDAMIFLLQIFIYPFGNLKTILSTLYIRKQFESHLT